MSASRPNTCDANGSKWERGGELYSLLFGEPLCCRATRNSHPDQQETATADRSTGRLDPMLKAVVSVMRRDLYSNDSSKEPIEQAELEWSRVVALPCNTYAQVAAKRAALLFALSSYKDLRLYFAFREPKLVHDLEHRILPLIMPVFLACQAQAPDSLVMLTAVLHTMWDPRDVGCAEYKQCNSLPETLHSEE
jgi:hypothetical protein